MPELGNIFETLNLGGPCSNGEEFCLKLLKTLLLGFRWFTMINDDVVGYDDVEYVYIS